MGSSRESLKRVLNCPQLILLASAFGFLYSYIDNFNPLPGVIMGFSGLGGDFLGTVISAISALLSPGTLLKGLIYLIIASILMSFLAGLYMSGFMNLIKCVTLNGRKGKGDFIEGIRKNSGRAIKASFIIIISAVMLLIVVAVALLPAMTTMWSALNGKKEILPVALFITILSVFAVFFVFLFYNVYTAFWYPAIACGYIKFIKVSKKVIDCYFFEVAAKVLKYTFEIIFITLIFILIRYYFSGVFQSTAGTAALILIEGIFITLWFLRMTNYVTNTFAELTERYGS